MLNPSLQDWKFEVAHFSWIKKARNGSLLEYQTHTSPQLTLQRDWYEEFFSRDHGTLPTYASLCITAQSLATPEGYQGVLDLLQPYRPGGVYLLLADFELGEESYLDDRVLRFIEFLRTDLGVQNIIMGRGPAWASILAPHGLSGYVTGINYMASLKRQYFTREEDIGGIAHNYYLARRFVRATPEAADQLFAEQLLDPCECPICQTAVPDTVNDIRQHYLFARRYEADEIGQSHSPRQLLRMWVREAGELLIDADALNIGIIGRPPLNRWARLLG